MIRLAGLLAVAAAVPSAAQESGWHFSPYPGEGDRAALGCSYASTPARHACIAVRCADDFTVTLHVDTTRLGGDAGRWSLSVDEGSTFGVIAIADDSSPYGTRVDGDVTPIIDAIRNGNSFFLDPLDGEAVPDRGIGLSGSLNAINRALYFCAPRVPPEEKETDDDG
jgi:hypothetical protein